jgi:hypothetical protein
MKYLKKFNEELKSETYRRASYKLKKLGHEDRSKELADWSKKVEGDENLVKWEEHKSELSKFGKFKLKITNPDTNQTFTGDFYLSLHLDRMFFQDSLDEIADDKEGVFWIAIGIVPADEKTLNDCMEYLPDNDMSNGFFWGLSLSLEFKIEHEQIKFTGYSIKNYDESVSGDVKIADRASAGKFKTLLKNMFGNPDFNYPSGYNDFQYFYEMVYLVFGAQFGLSSDYGFSPEVITDFINTMSANEMY